MNKCGYRLKPLVGMVSLLAASLLHAAPVFDPALQPLGSVAPLTLSNTDISSGAMAYRAWFENGSWQGDIVEYTVSNVGALSSSVNLSGQSPVNTGSPPANWSANVQFEAAEVANSTYWDNGREIVTWNGSAQKAFRWDSLSDTQKEAVDKAAFDNGDNASNVLNFVRGQRTNESSYRTRQNVLGDVIHSNPVYVGAPKGGFSNDDYADFASTNATRDERIYVGANDGMLHVFDADDGNEVWAYVPSMVVENLNALAGRPYTHRYYVDGALTSRDVHFESADEWHTILVGGLGAGGKGWFGLDITNENLADETATTGTDIKVLWELDASGDDNLGYSFGQATISKANDGNTYALVGNGYNSVNGIAVLYMVNVEDGSVVTLTTSNGDPNSPNGLSAPALVDYDYNGTVDLVYAGDIDGNMWKFDLSGDTTGSWGVAYSGTPLHPGVATQPIIQAPDVTRHPYAGHLVMFGTGRMFTLEDMADASTQAIYGIWDSGLTPPDSNTQDLLVQTLSGDLTYTATDISETVQTFTPDPGAINWSTQHGWKVELPTGFRALQPPQLRGGRLKITINEPNSRANYMLETYYLDGGAPESTIFDLDANGVLTTADSVDGNSDGDLLDADDIAVMWAQPAGVMSQPTIARVADGIDAQLLNYVVPPAELPCTDDCPNGFQGGHVDVDTDYYDDGNGGVGESTTKHSHEYDKSVGRVYIDYMDLLESGHMELDDTDTIPGDEEFIVVVANAEMSPGAVLTLGTVQYNTVEYQVMIHKKLRAWDGVSALTDDDGNSLIFTANAIKAGGGTVKQSFNDLAILAGGLHPTNTGCVKKGDNFANNRYRNGALVTQAIDRTIFTDTSGFGGGNQLDKLIVQMPDDLVSPMQFGRKQVDMMEDLDGDGSVESAGPDYEVFGGLRADISGQGDTDAYWESTIFWHYGGGDCYGTSNWESDVAATLDDLTIDMEEFDEMLAAIGVSGNINTLLQNYAYCKDDIESDGGVLEGGTGCQDLYEELEALYEVSTTIFGMDQDSLTGLESDGETPVTMEGAAAAAGLTVGPNFETGRRTWTDITAD